MRLVADIKDEQDVYLFYAFLKRQEIDVTYEKFEDGFHIWIYNEDDLEKAQEWHKRFLENNNDPIFQEVEVPIFPEATHKSKKEKWVIKKQRKKRPFFLTLTGCIILICAFVYIGSGLQRIQITKEKGNASLEIGFTPIQRSLLFDYPRLNEEIADIIGKYKVNSNEELKALPQSVQQQIAAIEAKPQWTGFLNLAIQWKMSGSTNFDKITLFEDIRQGEVWRLFSPAILHVGLLHIIFNMAWVFLLGKQIEDRLSIRKMILLILIIGIVSNVAQYLMSGPFFMGFSGVVVGMAGFIWMRQRVAPWEGYPLQKGTALFLLFFILAMFALEVVTLFLHFFQVTSLSGFIANTAHIVGGLVGLLLGRLSLFSRRQG